MSGFEMFCERCGKRYGSGEATAEVPQPLARRFLQAVGVVEPVRQAVGTDPLLRFCLACRGYTCPDCWNDQAGFCQTCVPLPEAAVAEHIHLPTVAVPAFGELPVVEPASEPIVAQPVLAEGAPSQPAVAEPVLTAAASASDVRFDSDEPVSLLERLEPWTPTVPVVMPTPHFAGQPRLFDPALVDPLMVEHAVEAEEDQVAVADVAADHDEPESVPLFDRPLEPDFEPWVPEPMAAEAVEAEPADELAPDEPWVPEPTFAEPEPEPVFAEAPAEVEPVLAEPEPELVFAEAPAEVEPVFAEAQAEVEPVFAEAEVEAEPEPVVAEPEPEPVFAEPEPELALAEAEVEPEPVVAEPEPKPEPVFAEPESKLVFAEAAAEAEPVLAVAEPEPEPVFAEPEPEPVFAAAEPEPVFAEPVQVVEPPAPPSAPDPTFPEVPATPTPTYRPLPPLGPIVPPPPPPPTVTPRIQFDLPQTPPAYLINQQQQAQPQPLAPRPQLPAGLFDGPGPIIRPCPTCDLPVSAKARFCRRCGSAQPPAPA